VTTYTYAQLEEIWIQGGGNKALAPLMAAIALAESAGNPDAKNATDNGGMQTSWGLWQISLGNHNAPASNWNDPVENARLAVGKLDSQGLGAWGTYTSGAYKQFMQGNVPPGTGSIPGGGGTGPTTTTGASGGSPLTWIESTIPGFDWFGGLITGASGGLSGIASIGDIATGISGLVRTFNKLIQLQLLLFRPSFWLRVGGAIFGTLELAGSVYFFGKTL
jgi:hypothetical protein